MSKEPKRNIYVGHRYVPKIMGEWDNTNSYEGLSIVTYKGNSFTSKKRVPKGIDINNNEYWASTGNYNAQIEEYRKDVKDMGRYVDKEVNQLTDYVNKSIEDKADKIELEKTDQQLADITNIITKYDKNESDKSDSEWINRSIMESITNGLNNLTLEKQGQYDIKETIIIPEGFILNMNDSKFSVNANTDVIIFDTYSCLINGEIEVYDRTFDKSILTWKESRIRHSYYNNLKLRGVSSTKGTAINLHADEIDSSLAYLNFNDIVISRFNTGIKLSINSEYYDVEGSPWVNANLFTNINMSRCSYMIDIDGHYWGLDGARGETSGNIFRNINIQIESDIKRAIRITGKGNQINGYIWDTGRAPTGTDIIVCDDKAHNNLIDIPNLTAPLGVGIKVNTGDNDVRGYKNGTPMLDSNIMGIPVGREGLRFNGNQDDVLMYADMNYKVNFIEGTPKNETSMFRPNGRTTYWSNITSVKFEIVFEDSPILLDRIGILFDESYDLPPRNVKITTTDKNNIAHEILDVSETTSYIHVVKTRKDQKDLKKISIEVIPENFSSVGIAQVFANSYNVKGNTFIDREGGEIYSSLYFTDSTAGPILTSDNGSMYRIYVKDDGELATRKQ